MTTARIGDLVTVAGGGTPRRSIASFYGGGIPWVTPKDMKRAEIDSSEVTLTEEGVRNSPAKLIRRGSTLVVVRSGVLKHTLPVAITTTDVTVNQDMKALTPRADMIYPRFLFRIVKAQEARVLRSVRATTAENFPIEGLLGIEIPVPPLPEQRRIAAILDEADALRTAAITATERLDDARASQFERLFPTDSEDLTTIGALLESTQYGTSGKAGAMGRFPILRMGNLTARGRIDLRDMKYIDIPDRDVEKYLVRKGDVLFNRTNSAELVGKTAVYREDVPRAYAGYLVRLRASDQVIAEYIAGYLNSVHGKRTLRRMAKSIVGMANINAREVQTIRLPAPSPEKLHAYKAFVDESWSNTARLESRARELESLFASLQHRAFRGEL